jgi:hypothetical protein
LLYHAAVGLSGCVGHAVAVPPPAPILSTCDAGPSFVDSTQLKRWGGFPVSVHVDLTAVPQDLRKTYREGIERGASLWSEATDGRIGKFAVNFDRPDSPVRIAVAEGRLPDHAIGLTELTFTGDRIVSASVRLTRSQFEGTAFLAHDVASTTAHEVGHVLGIVDHSPHPEDKMWVSGNFGVHNEGHDPGRLLTTRDVHTLEEAYCRP